jgi:methylmalonyl-CoA mutase C-terminal domain/subunit
MPSDRKIRVLVAKPGLDGHDRGARVIAYGLRDAGFEVIYTGLRRSPEAIAREAIQEDADVVGLSILSGAHLGLTGKVLELLREQGAGEIPVLVGGLIPERDKQALRDLGVAGVFTAGTPISEVAEFIESRVADA